VTVIITFCLCLAGFTAIGIYSVKRREKSPTDYLVAGRNVSPWLTALSSVATNSSGFMFIGLVGYAYDSGVEALWMGLGWVLGDLAAWMFVHRKIRERSGEIEANSVPTLVATDIDGNVSRPIIGVTAVITLLFLSIYAAAQLKAGGIALHTLFQWDQWIGVVIGAAIVVAYCYSGGLRASIWTDAAQAMVMFVAVSILLVVALIEVGGPASLLAKLEAINPRLIDLAPESMTFGAAAFTLGWVAGGFGAVGQPHIAIRTMALRSADDIPVTRAYYFLWWVPFFFMAIGVGLTARVLVPDLMGAAAEHALPALSQALLPNVLVGLVLAGLFSATMSTADSQLLSCSAAVTQDLFPRWRHSYGASKAATLGVASLSLVVALVDNDKVFAIVLDAWAALAATIGPVLVLRVFKKPVPAPVALLMIASGFLSIVAWHYSGYDGALYKLVPGLLVPFVVYGALRPRRVAPTG